MRMASLTLSSPPRPFRAFNISSSPFLPSPRDIVPKEQSLLRTESRLDSASCNSASFSKSTSVTLFSIDRLSTDIDFPLELGSTRNEIAQNKGLAHANEGSVAESDSVQVVANLAGTTDLVSKIEKKTRKPRTKKEDKPAREGGPKEKAPRKPRAKKADRPAGEDGLKEKAPRKPRAKKKEGGAQTKLPQLQVTKSSTPSKSKDSIDAAKSREPEVISRHFSTVDLSTAPKDSLSNGLLEAVKRRTSWTPPKPTVETTGVAIQISDAADDMDGLAECASFEENGKGFSDLFGKFAFSSIQAPIPGRISSDGSGIKKRKLIEMLPTGGFTSDTATAAPKAKAPKKKARTITEKAISAYGHERGSSTSPTSLLQYFSSETANGGTNDGFKVPSKPRSKKSARTLSKHGEGTAQAPILLSPESALKQVGNQDFVFGTSSQLAREESPTFLRDMHAAMQASNEVDDDDPFIDPFYTSTVTPVRSEEERPVLLAKRNLWSAAARDTGGKLLDIQMVDLSNSPATTSIAIGSFIDAAPVAPVIPKFDSNWHDIEELVDDDVIPKSKVVPTQSPELPLPLESSSLGLGNLRGPGLSAKALCMPQSSDTISHVTQSVPTNNTSSTEYDLDKPDYSSYTSAELAKEIASYRFKPLKNRNQMITLLEKCWEGKQRTALGSLQANTMLHSPSNPVTKPPSDQPKTTSPKRPRGGPRSTTTSGPSQKAKGKKTVPSKTSAVGHSETNHGATQSKAVGSKNTQNKTKVLADEICDSDAPLTPSPPRRHPSQIRTPPLPLQVAHMAVECPATTLASSQTRLFGYITRAVTNAPPSKDPTNPSWHEKMLLYDPIILEDLAVWLNTGPLEKAGWDGEVHPGEVKKWCISKSICCLWKENLRGGVRTRF